MSTRPPVELARFYPQLLEIKDTELRRGVETVFQELWDQSKWSDLAELPLSGEIGYPNLPHTQCIVTMACAIADALTRYHGTPIDRDLLIASAILQDASKLVEYEPDAEGRAVHTEIGRNYPHGFWCAHLAVQHGIPHAVSHITMTHGSASPKFPDSLEGKILFHVDQLDVIAVAGERWRKQTFIAKAPKG